MPINRKSYLLALSDLHTGTLDNEQQIEKKYYHTAN